MRIIRTFLLITFILLLSSMTITMFNHDSRERTMPGVVSSARLFAQEPQKAGPGVQPRKAEPVDSSAALYKVTGIVLVVWIGIALLLIRIDRKIAGLEKDLNSMR